MEHLGWCSGWTFYKGLLDRRVVAGRVLCIAGDWDNVVLLFWASLVLRLTCAVLNTLSVSTVDLSRLRIHFSLKVGLWQLKFQVGIHLAFFPRKGSHISLNPSKAVKEWTQQHRRFFFFYIICLYLLWCSSLGLMAAGARNVLAHRLHGRLICSFVMNQYCAKCWLQ